MKFDAEISAVTINNGESLNIKKLGTWTAGKNNKLKITASIEEPKKINRESMESKNMTNIEEPIKRDGEIKATKNVSSINERTNKDIDNKSVCNSPRKFSLILFVISLFLILKY